MKADPPLLQQTPEWSSLTTHFIRRVSPPTPPLPYPATSSAVSPGFVLPSSPDTSPTDPLSLSFDVTQYAMPFTLATTAGLVAVALENTPSFPTFPRRMSSSEIGAGLVLPFAAQTVLGQGGAAAVLILMFS